MIKKQNLTDLSSIESFPELYHALYKYGSIVSEEGVEINADEVVKSIDEYQRTGNVMLLSNVPNGDGLRDRVIGLYEKFYEKK